MISSPKIALERAPLGARASVRSAGRPHPDPAIRASYVDYAGHIIEQVPLTVGEVLGRVYPDGWFTENMKPLIDDLHALRRSSPIDPASVSRL